MKDSIFSDSVQVIVQRPVSRTNFACEAVAGLAPAKPVLLVIAADRQECLSSAQKIAGELIRQLRLFGSGLSASAPCHGANWGPVRCLAHRTTACRRVLVIVGAGGALDDAIGAVRHATVAMVEHPAALPLAIAVASEYWQPVAAEPVAGEPARQRTRHSPVAVVPYPNEREPAGEPDLTHFDDAPPLMTPIEASRAIGHIELIQDARTVRPTLAVCIGGEAEHVSYALERFAFGGPIYGIGSTGGAAANRDVLRRVRPDIEESLCGSVRERERLVSWPEEGHEFRERLPLEIAGRSSLYPLLMSRLMDEIWLG